MRRFHETVFGIYFDDLDPFKILHNARYLLLFERTLGAFWMELGFGSLQDAEHPHQFHLVRHNEVDYLRPVDGVCRVRVRVNVERLGTSSLTFQFRLMPLDCDEDYALGRRTVVHVDRDTMKPAPWTEEFRELMRPWVSAEPVA